MSLFFGEQVCLEASATAGLQGQSRWYAIRTQSRKDALAELNLRRQNIRVFIPRTLKRVCHARKVETRKAPLFPGYGFVELDLAREGWRRVNSTVGVAHLITAFERPLAVPVGIVEDFLSFSDTDGIVDLSKGLAIGAEVRLRNGPLAGATGLLRGLDDKGRVEVLLQIMNGQITVKTSRELLETIM
ncbi:transcription termination/antitermination protein NusG [Oryzibacter oryziterrae]|uniref:transcription termination/antitermination protein NusG n=1 Tax=Oryzibacter oryziterrae TaxID=2766474 RepID=UPI001F3C3A3B|nr:transcription termination/antitermination NusG family protein [Oryzibacter oryziterrae]